MPAVAMSSTHGELRVSPIDIRRVVAELYEVFDIRSLEEAQQHFEESPY